MSLSVQFLCVFELANYVFFLQISHIFCKCRNFYLLFFRPLVFFILWHVNKWKVLPHSAMSQCLWGHGIGYCMLTMPICHFISNRGVGGGIMAMITPHWPLTPIPVLAFGVPQLWKHILPNVLRNFEEASKYNCIYTTFFTPKHFLTLSRTRNFWFFLKFP